MTSQEILRRYIEFFKMRGHAQIPNVSLVPENDPTLLFVNSGMFPLMPYLAGQPHPLGKRLVSVQRCLRFEELDDVGDNRHTVAFHMLGNWGLGDYFKVEQLNWIYEFLISDLGLDASRLYATVFAGDEDAPKDRESIETLQEIFAKHGVEAEEGQRIFTYGKEENWWQRGDTLGELGGTDSEIFYYLGDDEKEGLGKDPVAHQDEFLEIGNSVFMNYKKTETGWEEMPAINIDFGGGLERLALACQKKHDIFETDMFWPIVEKICELSGKEYKENEEVTKSMRILADHVRASVFLAMDRVEPGNKDQGYVLRRLLRRMIRSARGLGAQRDVSGVVAVALVPVVCEMFGWLYPDLPGKQENIQEVFTAEEEKFNQTLEDGKKALIKRLPQIEEAAKNSDWEEVSNIAFDFFQSRGYPIENFIEDLEDKGIEIDGETCTKLFGDICTTHQKKSKEGSVIKFKGGLADHSENTIKYHTTAHLLMAGLRGVLGEEVTQKGANITGERLRFDFNHGQKLTPEEISAVEDYIAQKIKEGLPVKQQIMSKNEAMSAGAAYMKHKMYPEQVRVYIIGDDITSAISKEFCGGPHMESTSELAPLEIYKQENVGKGIRRIYAKFKT